MLPSIIFQALSMLVIVSGAGSGGYMLYYLQRAAGEFLVSKETNTNSKKIDSYVCKIKGDDKNVDSKCKVFSIAKDDESNISVKDFKSASFEITPTTLTSGNFFKMRLNTNMFPTIDISQENVVNIVKSSDNSVITSFRIHARLSDGNLESYANHFIARLDTADKNKWNSDFSGAGKFNYSKCKSYNFSKHPETDSHYDNCNIDEITDVQSTSKLKNVDMTKVKPWYWTSKIEHSKLKENQLFVIRVSGKYWKRLVDSNLKFDVKLWSLDNPLQKDSVTASSFTGTPQEFQLTFVQSVVIKEDHTKTHIEGTDVTHIQDLFLI